MKTTVDFKECDWGEEWQLYRSQGGSRKLERLEKMIAEEDLGIAQEMDRLGKGRCDK